METFLSVSLRTCGGSNLPRKTLLFSLLMSLTLINTVRSADTLWYLPPKASSVRQSGWLPRPFVRLVGQVRAFEEHQVKLIVDDAVSAEASMEQSIAFERIVWIETDWSSEPNVAAAMEAFEQGRFAESLQPLTEYVKTSNTQWRRLIAYGYLMLAAAELQRYDASLAIASGFYQSQPPDFLYHLMPIAWTTPVHSVARQQAAVAQLASSNRGVALVAASWLLAGPHREQADAVLQKISNDPADAVLARLADAVRWRLATGEDVAKSLDRWEEKIDRIPIALQPGPMTTIADRLRANGLSGEAAVWWLSVATLGKRAGRLADQAEAALQKIATENHPPTTD
ncbi:MAG: hypothetical protein R3C05_27690 [Pirellulaceae bacterium]